MCMCWLEEFRCSVYTAETLKTFSKRKGKEPMVQQFWAKPNVNAPKLNWAKTTVFVIRNSDGEVVLAGRGRSNYAEVVHVLIVHPPTSTSLTFVPTWPHNALLSKLNTSKIKYFSFFILEDSRFLDGTLIFHCGALSFSSWNIGGFVTEHLILYCIKIEVCR